MDVSIPIVLQDYHLSNVTLVDKIHTDFSSLAHIGGFTHYITDQRNSSHTKRCFVEKKCDTDEFLVAYDEKSRYSFLESVITYLSCLLRKNDVDVGVETY